MSRRMCTVGGVLMQHLRKGMWRSRAKKGACRAWEAEPCIPGPPPRRCAREGGAWLASEAYFYSFGGPANTCGGAGQEGPRVWRWRRPV